MAYHAEGGLRAFGEFVGELRKAHPDLRFNEAEAAAAYRVEAAKSGATIDEAAMSAEALKRAAPQGMPEGLQKIRESLTDGLAREASDLKYVEMTSKPNGLKCFEAMVAANQKKGTLASFLETQYQKDIATLAAKKTIDDYTPAEQAVIAAVKTAGVDQISGFKLVDVAKEIGLFNTVEKLIQTKNLDNPYELVEFVKKIKDESNVGNNGSRVQLEEVARLAEARHKVSLEESKSPAGKADIIDHTAREAIQMDVVSSKDPEKVELNVKTAINQLRGDGLEFPPTGYKKIVDVRFDGDGKLKFYEMNRDQLRQVLTVTPPPIEMKNIDAIRIHTKDGVQVFKVGDL